LPKDRIAAPAKCPIAMRDMVCHQILMRSSLGPHDSASLLPNRLTVLFRMSAQCTDHGTSHICNSRPHLCSASEKMRQCKVLHFMQSWSSFLCIFFFNFIHVYPCSSPDRYVLTAFQQGSHRLQTPPPDVATCGVSLSTRHFRVRDIMCKHDVVNIQHAHTPSRPRPRHPK